MQLQHNVPNNIFPTQKKNFFHFVSETGVSILAAPPTDATTVFCLLFKREKAFLSLQTGTKKLATKGKGKKKRKRFEIIISTPTPKKASFPVVFSFPIDRDRRGGEKIDFWETMRCLLSAVAAAARILFFSG